MKIEYRRGFDMRDENGVYSYKGRRYYSTTTVLGPFSDFVFVHNNSIAKYVVDLVHANYEGRKIPKWSQVPDPFGELIWQLSECDAGEALLDVDWLKNEGFRFLKRCADRGSTIHDIFSDYARGMDLAESQLKDYLQDRIMGHSRSCTVEECFPYAVSALDFLDSKRPRIVISEAAVFNDEHEHAGTIDVVAMNEGQFPDCDKPFVEWDCKTSETFKREWSAQVAANKNTEFAVVNDDGMPIEVPMPSEADCATLQLLEGEWKWRVIKNVQEAYQDFFLPALKAYRAHKHLALPPKALTKKVTVRELCLVEGGA